ncbi:MAG: hypothetical protein HYZ53_01850 [Planctomycetes bacterium]|nr:hypothetical protein [Planctomycetota bacterium]
MKSNRRSSGTRRSVSPPSASPADRPAPDRHPSRLGTRAPARPPDRHPPGAPSLEPKVDPGATPIPKLDTRSATSGNGRAGAAPSTPDGTHIPILDSGPAVPTRSSNPPSRSGVTAPTRDSSRISRGGSERLQTGKGQPGTGKGRRGPGEKGENNTPMIVGGVVCAIALIVVVAIVSGRGNEKADSKPAAKPDPSANAPAGPGPKVYPDVRPILVKADQCWAEAQAARDAAEKVQDDPKARAENYRRAAELAGKANQLYGDAREKDDRPTLADVDDKMAKVAKFLRLCRDHLHLGD